MDQAPLNNDCGLQQEQGAKNVWITVDCCTLGVEPSLLESLAKREKVAEAFINTIRGIDEMVGLAIQRGIHPAS